MNIGMAVMTVALGLLTVGATGADFHPPGPNVALHRPYTLSPAPNYEHCTDANDRVQLTDGIYTDGYFWTQKTTVGWVEAKPVQIVIDLGAVMPIAGVSLSTAAGVAGVAWPAGIALLVSDDGASWWPAGDLVTLSQAYGAPPATGYATYRYVTDALRCRGRYVAFQITPSPPFAFCDEIEIYRGPDALMTLPRAGAPVRDLMAYYRAEWVASRVRRAITADATQIQARLSNPHLSTSARTRIASQVERALAEADRMSPQVGARLTLPLGTTHRTVLAARAALWRAQGIVTRIWQSNPWDPIAPDATPTVSAPVIGITMLRNEVRNACLNITNTGSRPLHLAVRPDGLPGGATPPWLEVHNVAWTLTTAGTPVASALPEATKTSTGWTVNAPVGMTSQIWFRVNSVHLGAGEYRGHVAIVAGNRVLARVPVNLHVSHLRMPDQLALSLGGWDYTDGPGRDITTRNLASTVAFLRRYHVDAPWATAASMPYGVHSTDGAMVTPPVTTRMDQWLQRWPNARMYLVFASVSGPPPSTSAERRRVREWITFWTQHLAQRGVQASRLGLLLIDEPSTAEASATIAAYAREIHAAAPGVTVFEDPVYEKPSEMGADLVGASDMLCPNRPMWLANREAFEKAYLPQREEGKRLAFYSCSGPVRSLDPYSYHRLQAWDCFRYGMVHEGFWAFSDAGGGSAWNEMTANGSCYTPQFLDASGCVTSKHMEAILEGLYDYQTLALLQRAVDARRSDPTVASAVHRAMQLLADGPRKVVLAAGAGDIEWTKPKDRGIADRVRSQAIRLLEQLTPIGGPHYKPAAR